METILRTRMFRPLPRSCVSDNVSNDLLCLLCPTMPKIVASKKSPNLCRLAEQSLAVSMQYSSLFVSLWVTVGVSMYYSWLFDKHWVFQYSRETVWAVLQKKIVVFSVLGAKDLHKVVQRTDLKILMDNSTKMYLGVFLHLEKEEEYDLLLVKKLELYFPPSCLVC